MSEKASPRERPRLLGAAAPELRATADLRVACQLIGAYEAPAGRQRTLQREILATIERFPRTAHLRTCLPGHLTASALVVDEQRERVLLLHHRKLGKWLQPGGHCDGDANVLGVAFREAREETGLDALAIDPRVLDLDIHEIPARPGEPAHLHLDTRFLVIAPRDARPRRNEESNELRWFTPQEALAVADDSLARLVRLLLLQGPTHAQSEDGR
ncbi:MAG: NUDIX hydrolase [Acidobacteriota bacterium]